MKRLVMGTLFVVLLLISAAFLRADETLQDLYLRIYVKMHEGENLEKKNDYRGTLIEFRSCISHLVRIHNLDASWEPALINHRIQGCKDALAQLVPLATKQLRDQPKLAEPAGPVESTLWNDGFRLEKEKDYWTAVERFEGYVTIVEIMRHLDAKWDTPLNAKRLDQARAEIERLEKMELQTDHSNKT